MKNYKFWFKTGSVLLILTGCIHAMSLLNDPAPANEQERQLFDLLANYRFPLPGVVGRSMQELVQFFSLSLTLFSVFLGGLNLFFAKNYMPSEREGGYLVAQLLFWTIFLVPLLAWTFLIPIVCYALAWLCFVLAWALHRNARSSR